MSVGRQMCLWGGRSGAALQHSWGLRSLSVSLHLLCGCVAAPSPHCEVAGAVDTRTKERDGQRAQGFVASGPPSRLYPTREKPSEEFEQESLRM